MSESHQVLRMLLLKKKYLKHELRNKCKGGPGRGGRPRVEFVVSSELEVVVE